MKTSGVARIGSDHYLTHILISGHAIDADEPIQNGGENKGPAPYDLLLSSLAACTAITLRMYADRKQWPLRNLEVGVNLLRTLEGALVVKRTLKCFGLDEKQQRRMVEIAEKTPVTLTLKAGLTIHTAIAS
jgi:putative redox protein